MWMKSTSTSPLFTVHSNELRNSSCITCTLSRRQFLYIASHGEALCVSFRSGLNWCRSFSSLVLPAITAAVLPESEPEPDDLGTSNPLSWMTEVYTLENIVPYLKCQLTSPHHEEHWLARVRSPVLPVDQWSGRKFYLCFLLERPIIHRMLSPFNSVVNSAVTFAHGLPAHPELKPESVRSDSPLSQLLSLLFPIIYTTSA